MRLTREDKQKLTERIRRGAAEAFRESGYDGVNLDELMKKSGLTRGTFYAHFSSKRALFEDVVRHEHPLLQMLRRRDGKTAAQLRNQLVELFKGYLDPNNLDEVFLGCSLAALTGDVTRSDDAVKEAHGIVFNEILEEMARKQGCSPKRFTPALVLSAGAVQTAMAVSDSKQRSSILRAALKSFRRQIEEATTGARN